MIEDGLVRFRKIQLDFLIRLFPLRILRDELLLILIRKFCCLDAYSFRLCAGVRFECLFREHELPQLIPSFLLIFVHFCTLNYFTHRNLIGYDL